MLKGKDIILVSSCNYTLHTKNVLNAQIIANELADRGNKVLFVESLGLKTLPLAGKTDWFKVIKRGFDFLKLLFFGATNPRKNIYVLSLARIPFETNKFIKKFNSTLITKFVRRYSSKYLSPDPILWIFLPTGHFLIDKVDHSMSIYQNVDDYSEVPFVDKKYILGQEKEILKKADLVITVSPVTKEKFDKLVDSSKVVYLNNVARFQLFNQSLTETISVPDDMKAIVEEGKPIVGFMGNMASYKENIELITEVADKGKEYNFVFIGPVGSGEAFTNISKLQSLKNVHFLGPKDYDSLYKYFKYWDVAYIARRLNQANEGGFPLKYFEYMASGLPVIVTGIGSLKEFSTKPELGGIANTREEFLMKIKYWTDMKKGNRKEWERNQKIRIAIAKENSWDKRMKQFDDIISKYI